MPADIQEQNWVQPKCASDKFDEKLIIGDEQPNIVDEQRQIQNI